MKKETTYQIIMGVLTVAYIILLAVYVYVSTISN